MKRKLLEAWEWFYFNVFGPLVFVILVVMVVYMVAQ